MPIKRRSKAQVDFSMASMTDLIFLLLIFFMITASFVEPSALKLTLPSATSTPEDKTTATVSIDKQLNYYFKDTKIPIDRLPDVLQSELSNKADPVLMISADKSVPIDNVVQVMKIGKALKAKTVLATKPD
jgi:biopolymer transport protein ExbD